MKTTLYRLSKDGFQSYYQEHHVVEMESGLKDFKENRHNYPQHLRYYIENNYKELMPNWGDFVHGVFAFVGSLPDKETIRLLTNHLNVHQKDEYVWWTGEIEIEEYAFEGNNLWKKTGFQKIKELVDRDFFEIYIPQQFLKVTNVQKWTQDYKKIDCQNKEIQTNKEEILKRKNSLR